MVSGPVLVLVAAISVCNWLIYENARTSPVWIEEPLAKSLFALERVREGERLDVVFVGSSRTQYHIDSEIIEKTLGIRVFNYGLPGRELDDYPYVVARAAAMRPATIVIAFPYEALVRDTTCSRLPNTLAEIRFYLRNGRYDCIVSGGLARIVQTLPMNRFRAFTAERQLRDEDLEKTWLEQVHGYDVTGDPRRVNYIRGIRDHLVVTYANGDAQAFDADHTRQARPRRPHELQAARLNPGVLEYLRQLAGIATDQGIDVLYVIEPGHSDRRAVMPSPVIARINDTLPDGVSLVNLDAPEILTSMWADSNHLDLRGTRIYSRLLADTLGSRGLDGKRVH